MTLFWRDLLLITRRIGVRAGLSYRTALIEYPLCIEANAWKIRYPVKGSGRIAGIEYENLQFDIMLHRFLL